ncbi:MAG: M3 family metallopeptidase [Alphaproteobacteria bacterium]
MRPFRALAIATALAATVCAPAIAAQTSPFAAPSTLPLEAPPFDKIDDSHYAPGFEEAMKQELAEIDAIANAKDAPTFENTIVTMEKTGQMLTRVNAAFQAVVQANTNTALDKIQSDVAPKLAAHRDAIFLNEKLFKRVKQLYDRRDSLNLDPEPLHLLKVYYDEFVHAGANLSKSDKAKLREINKKIATLETDFQQKLVAAAKAGALVVDDKAALAGLPETEIAAAAQAAKDRGLEGKYVIPLQNTTQQPSLSSLSNRETRQKLFENSWRRAERGDDNDTRAIILELAKLRVQKAKLMDYPDYASYVLYDQMAKTPAAVKTFLDQLTAPTAAKIADEAKAIQAMIEKTGGNFELKPWDWNFYSEKVRKAEYDLDQNELKPYFELDNVLVKGVFHSANLLYGITFKERKDIPVYHPEVRVWDVFDKDGSQLAIYYFDPFKRDNKQGGAWMSNFVEQSKLLGTKPVVYNVMNIAKPAPGEPALLTYDNVNTLFHEFGHTLHGLFANTKYPSLSGTNTARDWVEFPSQANEYWATWPSVLKNFAIHYKTGKPIPQALVNKIKKSETFNQGYELGELLAASQLDLQWHLLAGETPKNVEAFEEQALKVTNTNFPGVPTRYRTTYFLHIWSSGYAAAYYAYQWTFMLAADTDAWFKQHGGPTRANGQRYRDLILSRGQTEEYGKMFRKFYGKDPDIGPMLEQRGLTPVTQ